MSIENPNHWQESPQGQHVLSWVQQHCDHAVVDVFGFNALQIGLEQRDLLAANRIPLRIKMGNTPESDLWGLPTELPLASQSVDLVVLPFVLDFDTDPHQVLREVERVLRPEGQLLIIGFNPWSLWGLGYWGQRVFNGLIRRPSAFPWNGKYLSISRLRDWLHLLSFDVDRGHLGCYLPPCRSQALLSRLSFLESAGRHCWPFAGGVYVLRAVKRVRGMRLMPPWSAVKRSTKAVLKPELRGISGATGVQQKGKLE